MVTIISVCTKESNFLDWTTEEIKIVNFECWEDDGLRIKLPNSELFAFEITKDDAIKLAEQILFTLKPKSS
jgi:hypothetical protein